MKPTVLLLDDDRDNLIILENVIKRLRNVNTVTAVSFTSAREALAWCCQSEPDLCLIDYMMPGMDGLDFITAARKLPGFRDVPIVMITGISDQKLRQDALATGATDFWLKPIDPHEVRVRLGRFLDLLRPSNSPTPVDSFALG